MKFGLYGLHRDRNVAPDVLARRAALAEQSGFESLWVGDHIALPPGEGNPPRLEALIALTYLAAVTSRIRLGVGLIVLPQRQPVLLAKQLTSLDVLSGGRLTVAVGAGYVEPELHAMGVALSERGARTDEYLAAMHALWTAEPAFTGRFASYAVSCSIRRRSSHRTRRSWSAATPARPTAERPGPRTAGTGGAWTPTRPHRRSAPWPRPPAPSSDRPRSANWRSP